jgi:Periplasmic component of the Tol biopolymer transport system
MAAHRRRRVAVVLSVVTIASVTTFLLARLAGYPSPPLPPSPPSPGRTAAPGEGGRGVRALSPTFRIAFDDGDGNVSVMNADGSSRKLILKDASQPCWSPDRKRLAFARKGNLWIANADGTGQRRLTRWAEDPDNDLHGISWDPARGRIAFGRAESVNVVGIAGEKGGPVFATALYEVDPAGTAAPVRLFGFRPERPGRIRFTSNEYPAWSADGKTLAFARNGDLWLAHRGEGGEIEDADRLAAAADYDEDSEGGSRWTVAVTAASWAPDGSWLAYGRERVGGSGVAEVRVARLGDGTPGAPRTLEEDRLLPVYGWSPRVSPDGEWVLFCGYPLTGPNGTEVPSDPEHRGLWAISRDGRTTVRLPAGDGPERQPLSAIW